MWYEWWTGCLERPDVVVWLPVYWWGRLGTIMSLTSLLAIGAELAGRKRLLEFAKTLSRTSSTGLWRKLRRNAATTSALLKKSFEAWNTAYGMIMILGLIGVCILGGGLLITPWLFGEDSLVVSTVQAVSGFAETAFKVLKAMTLAVFLILIACSVPLGVVRGVMWLSQRFAENIAWILGKPRLDRYLKLVSIVGLAFGMALNLLAS